MRRAVPACLNNQNPESEGFQLLQSCRHGKISGKRGPDSKALQQAVKEGETNDLNIRPISSYFAQPANAAGSQ